MTLNPDLTAARERLTAVIQGPGPDTDLTSDLRILLKSHEDLSAKVERLEGALKPFAAVYGINEQLSAGWSDDKPNCEFIPGGWPTWGDFRRARLTLSQLRGET